MTVTPSELARAELVERIVDEVDRQLGFREYQATDRFWGRPVPPGKLTPRGRTDLGAVIEDALDDAERVASALARSEL